MDTFQKIDILTQGEGVTLCVNSWMPLSAAVFCLLDGAYCINSYKSV